MYEIQCVTNLDIFKNLREWNLLLNKNPDSNVFLTHEWLSCWCDAYSSHNKLLTILFYQDSRLIGAVPIMRTVAKLNNIPVKVIQFMENSHTGRMNFLLSKDRRKIINQFLSFFFEQYLDWDVAFLNRIPKESENNWILRELLNHYALPYKILNSLVSPYIPIRSNWDTFLLQRTNRFMGTLRNNQNRLKKLGNITIECIDADSDYKNLDDYLRDIFYIGEKSWKGMEKSAIGSTNENKKFYSTLAYTTAQKGWLQIWLLKINENPVAFEYHLVYKGKDYALKSSYDLDFRKCSPGSSLAFEVIKNSFKNNYYEIDLLGQMDAYKLRYKPSLRKHDKFIIFSNSTKGKWLAKLELKIIPIVKGLPFLKK